MLNLFGVVIFHHAHILQLTQSPFLAKCFTSCVHVSGVFEGSSLKLLQESTRTQDNQSYFKGQCFVNNHIKLTVFLLISKKTISSIIYININSFLARFRQRRKGGKKRSLFTIKTPKDILHPRLLIMVNRQKQTTKSWLVFDLTIMLAEFRWEVRFKFIECWTWAFSFPFTNFLSLCALKVFPQELNRFE